VKTPNVGDKPGKVKHRDSEQRGSAGCAQTHRHGHDHAEHSHRPSSRRVLLLALCLTLGFALVEAIGGWMAGSSALLSDAGYMLTDSSALGLAALAAWFAARPPFASALVWLGRLIVLPHGCRHGRRVTGMPRGRLSPSVSYT